SNSAATLPPASSLNAAAARGRGLEGGMVRDVLLPIFEAGVPTRVVTDALAWGEAEGLEEVIAVLRRYVVAVQRLDGTQRSQRRWLSPRLLSGAKAREVVRDVAEA